MLLCAARTAVVQVCCRRNPLLIPVPESLPELHNSSTWPQVDPAARVLPAALEGNDKVAAFYAAKYKVFRKMADDQIAYRKTMGAVKL